MKYHDQVLGIKFRSIKLAGTQLWSFSRAILVDQIWLRQNVMKTADLFILLASSETNQGWCKRPGMTIGKNVCLDMASTVSENQISPKAPWD